MTDEDLTISEEATELEGLRGSDRELEGFQRVGRLPPRSKGARSVVSIRLGASEMREIATVAGVLERNVSEFIRDAALKEARQVRAGIDEARQAVLSKEAGRSTG